MRPTRTLTAALLLGAALAGCGSSSNDTSSSGSGGSGSGAAASGSAGTGGPCAAGGSAASSGGSVSIGAKPFGEEKLLAEMVRQVLTKHGYTVDFSTTAADPAIDQALRGGKIDMLWQYTGTELQNFLGVDKPPTDLDQAFAMAKDKDAANGLCWVAPAKFDDTNGIAIRQADKGRFGSTLSAFSAYLKDHQDTKICIASEFRGRPDGLPGLDATYGNWGSLSGLSDIQGTAEKQLGNNQCDAGEVYTTDAAISVNNLYVLQDDKKLFPPDNVGLIVKASVLAQHPDIATLIQPVSDKLTTDVMVGLNRKVDVDNKAAADVARDWLTQNGLL